MNETNKNKRKHDRYDTELKVYFDCVYELKTLVKFQVKDPDAKTPLLRKYSALSKNISAEGICFSTGKKLNPGDLLKLEIYLPQEANPICMDGEVRWCTNIPSLAGESESKFDVGIRLLTVADQSVENSVYFDEPNQITWSVVLESVLGGFKTARFKRAQPDKP